MAKLELHPDFKDFLELLNSNHVEYLVVGGYAVGYHGYPRTTGDLDVWIGVSEENAEKIAKTLVEFGMPAYEISAELFMEKDRIMTMGMPPVQIEIVTGIPGVDFDECYARKVVGKFGELVMNFIGLNDLKAYKKAIGKEKDVEDLENLP
ncbi:MAG: hypothetical protein GF307_14745 [candidate division Zixibacteria bacterium]|nr:hypothetical protein [candidate division Zixibacteria bacterium]